MLPRLLAPFLKPPDFLARFRSSVRLTGSRVIFAHAISAYLITIQLP